MTRERMTRRRFLARMATAATSLGILGLGVQCGATPTPELTEVIPTETPVVKETPPPEVTEAPETEVSLTAVGQKKLVRIIVSSCAWVMERPKVEGLITQTELQATYFNDAHPDIEVQIESIAPCWGPEGWGPKVMSQIAEKKLEWCGMMAMYPFIEIVSRAKSGVHVPMEDHIAASKEPGADRMLEDMFPFVLGDVKYQDHIYGIPYGFAAETVTYHRDLCDAAGWKKSPKTWEELYAACADFRKVHEAEVIVPYAWAPSLRDSLHPYIHSATETPYTEDGLLDFKGAGVECLKFMRRLVEAGFALPGELSAFGRRFVEHTLGAALTHLSYSLYLWQHGDVPALDIGSPQTKVKGGGAGTLFNSECATLFQSAPYPQELVDFLISSFGPANTAMQKRIIQAFFASPVYQSFYDEVIAKDPMYSDYVWMKDIVDVAAASVVPPRNEYWPAQAAAYEKWAPQYFEEGSELTAEETAKNILDEVKAEIGKMG